MPLTDRPGAAQAAVPAAARIWRHRHRPPGLDVDGEPLTSDEQAALDRIEVATLTSLPAYDDGGELP